MYRSETNGGPYQVITNTMEISFFDSGLQDFRTHYYGIESVYPGAEYVRADQVIYRALGQTPNPHYDVWVNSGNDWSLLTRFSSDEPNNGIVYMSGNKGSHCLRGGADTDTDRDGHTDIYEYAFGGNPTNISILAQGPHLGVKGDGHLSGSDLGIYYVSEYTENLVHGDWTNSGKDVEELDAFQNDYFMKEMKFNGRTNSVRLCALKFNNADSKRKKVCNE